MNGFTVEYSDDGRTVYVIINDDGMYLHDMTMLMKQFKREKFKHWLPGDSRGAYVFSKDKPRIKD